MDGEIRVIDNIGQFGSGCVVNGAFLCYTKEYRGSDAKLTEIIPLDNVRRLSPREAQW